MDCDAYEILVDDYYVIKELQQFQQLRVPQTLGEALRLAADLSDKVAIMEPKADYYDGLVERGLCSSIRDTVKKIKVGERKLVRLLLGNGYLYRDAGEQLRPYSQYVPQPFEMKEVCGLKSYWACNQTLITAEGRDKLRLLLSDINAKVVDFK